MCVFLLSICFSLRLFLFSPFLSAALYVISWLSLWFLSFPFCTSRGSSRKPPPYPLGVEVRTVYIPPLPDPALARDILGLVYRMLVGKLNYLTITWSKISSVSVVGRFICGIARSKRDCCDPVQVKVLSYDRCYLWDDMDQAFAASTWNLYDKLIRLLW